jgi:hypothetical protein
MKNLKRIVAFLILSAALISDGTGAAAAGRTESLCGKPVCCCPQMCKAKAKARIRCEMQAAQRCGIKSASSRTFLFQPSFAALRIGMTADAPFEARPAETRIRERAFPGYRSLERAPRDKPPAFLS